MSQLEALKSGEVAIDGIRGIGTEPPADSTIAQWILEDLEKCGTPLSFDGTCYRMFNGSIHNEISEWEIKRRIAEVLDNAQLLGVRPTSTRLGSVEMFLRTKCYVNPERFDSDPDVLVLENGTLDLTTVELRPTEAKDYAATVLNYAYDPDAVPTQWLQFLCSTVGPKAEFLQEFAGICLTPDTHHEVAAWLYGPPGSGKSTFIGALAAMLGARAGVLDLKALERSTFALAEIAGKTLLTCSEVPKNSARITDIINALVSGDQLLVDRKYRDAVLMTPRAKLLFASNALPNLDASNGVYRRFKVVEFPELPADVRDPMLKVRLREERAGILNWALEGLQRVRERGSVLVDKSIHEATEDFKASNDTAKLFVTDACILGPDKRVAAQKLYDAYKTYCLENGLKPKSNPQVAQDWRRLGFERGASNGRNYWHGVGLQVARDS